MRKIFAFAALCAAFAAFTGCTSEEEDLFGESAAQRLEDTPSKYSARLTTPEAGWSFQYFPTKDATYPQGIGYLMLAKFNKDGSVRVGMNNVFSGSRYQEDTSLWEIITDDGPVLTFDSYNRMLHAFSDPEDIPWTGGGLSSSQNERGTGVGGDYEFIITDSPEDLSYIKVKGKKRGTYGLLLPLEDGTDFQTYLDDVNTFTRDMYGPDVPNTYRITVGDNTYEMSHSQGFMNYYPTGSDPVVTTEQIPFLITKHNGKYVMRTRDAISLNGGEVKVQNFTYDEAGDRFVSETEPTCIITSSSPSALDFIDEVTAAGHGYKFTRKGDISDKMKQYVEQADKEVKQMGRLLHTVFSVDSLNLMRNTDGNPTWNIKTVPDKTASYNTYNYTSQRDGNNITYTYVGPASDGADGLLQLSSVNTLITQVMPQTWTVTPLVSTFNYFKIRFVAVADPELWFIMTYVK